jgi:KaiC/GvpD/RAD55 family RecA-like ATPase
MRGRDSNSAVVWRPVVRRLDAIAPTQVEWLWPGRFALGKFTLLIGDPGVGKSMLSLDVAARVSCGAAWPLDETIAPHGSVLLMSAEDDVADTVVPRLRSLGADLSQVRVMDAVHTSDGSEEMEFTLARHMAQLDEALDDMEDPRLVIIDPISSYLRGLDAHSNAIVRRMMTSLGRLAQQRRVAVVAITHLVKNAAGRMIGRALGSIAFSAAARAVWLVMNDPLDASRQVLLPVKNNLHRRVPGLAFRLLPSGELDRRPLEWEPAPVELSAEEIERQARQMLRGPAIPRGKTPREEAAECLRELLAGGPRLGRSLLREAEEQGFALRTVRRALRDIGATARKVDLGEYCYFLPGQETQIPESGVWLWLMEREGEME